MRRQSTPFSSGETTVYTAESLKAAVAQQWLAGASHREPTLDLHARQLQSEHIKILQATHFTASFCFVCAFSQASAERVARRHDGAHFGKKTTCL
jgi:IS5 family transposase